MTDKIQRIIFENWSSGHRVEYIGHLTKYVAANSDLKKTTLFYLSKNIVDDLLKNNNPIDEVNHKIVPDQYCVSTERGRLVWKYIEDTVKQYKGNLELILMNIDQFQFQIATSHLNKNISIKGIWFRPTIHFPQKTFKDKLKSYLRNIVIKHHFSNNNVKEIFILNDKNGVNRLNRKFLNKFSFLPDPIDVNDSSYTNLYSPGKPQTNDTSEIAFLIIGTIDGKKNLRNILPALIAASGKTNKEVKLVIAGKVSHQYKEEFNELVNKFRDTESASVIKLKIDDQFMDPFTFNQYINSSDVILMIYKDFYSSSGILGNAAKFGKIVIASDTGLVDSLVKTYKLGLTVDPNSIPQIQNSIESILSNGTQISGNHKEFIDDFKVEEFCRILLQHK